MTDQYDHYFRLYGGIYFGDLVDWPWFKAQAIAESGLNPTAVSPAGACGIMQLMPPTSAEIARQLWVNDHPFVPKINILMGIHYMHRMWSIWGDEKGIERLRFSLASYNAGAGNIIKAQKLAIKKDQWSSLVQVLPEVTGSHALETIRYVKRIERIRLKIISA